MKKHQENGSGYRIFNKYTTRKGSFFRMTSLSNFGRCLFALACFSPKLYGQTPVKEWDKTIGGKIQPLQEGHGLDLATLPARPSIRANTEPRQVGSAVFDLNGQAAATSTAVVPIEWAKFAKGMPQDEMGVAWRTAIRNSTLFILTNPCFPCSQNIKAKFQAYKADPNVVFTFLDADASKGDENRIRPPASFISTLAIALQTGAYSAQKTGISTADAAGFARCLINSVALQHKVNGGYWGNDWQSSLWCSMTGLGGWLLWDSLDATTRERVRKMVEYEANRFLLINPPVWNGTCCDTKAEENAWDATSIELAAAMMPQHPNRQRWVRKAIQYRMTQAARKSDLTNTTIYHGKAVKDWIPGYNIFEDGSVVNHNINPHPDYMSAVPASSSYGAFFYSLGGFPTPKANQFNLDIIYQCFVDKSWSAPSYATPGGTIYRSDTSIYWPPANLSGGGESIRSNYYYKWAAMDGFANMLGFDATVSKKGKYWEPIHANRLLKDMAISGGQPGSSNENGNEWAPIQMIGNAYLMHWLAYQGAIKIMDFNLDSLVTVSPQPTGVIAEYFDWTTNLTALPNLTGKVANATRTEVQINYASTSHAWTGLDSTKLKDTYVARYSGYVKIATAGTYTFYVNSDDGSQLWLDDTLLVNNNGNHGMVEKSGTLTLAAGHHAIRLEYYEHTQDAGLIFSWQGPGIAKQVVPASALFTQAAPAEMCSASGTILRELWSQVSGSSLTSIPLNTLPTLTDQLTSLRTAANYGDNYGQRIRGYICPPDSGNYTFFIQGDDHAELWLSSDNNPANKQRIASASLAWEWAANSSQQSDPISLVAGKSYYVEVLHKEGTGADVLRIGWRTPGMADGSAPLIIPGSVLSPFMLPGNARQSAQEQSTPEANFSFGARLLPNPAQDKLSVTVNVPAAQIKAIAITDASGISQVVRQPTIGDENQLEINVSHLKAGFYLLNLQAEQRYQVVKFIKH